MKKVGVYVHFPFCVSKCKYCNFNSYSGKDNLQLDYFRSLIKEISMRSNKDIEIDTIFIGGGTPSVMFDGAIATLISELKKNYRVLDDAEITIEANPNSVTLAKAREWKESGINRVSVGLQTTNSSSLKLLGRAHTRNDYVNAIELLKAVGLTNINTDCLIGLPRQKLSNVKHTLNLVNKLGCPHISVYSLILEEDTPLYQMVSSGQVKLPKEEKSLNMYNYTYDYLKSKGYTRYEVSNFAKDGFECKHNLHTWQMQEYIGLGAGAHGYLDGVRYNNVPIIEEYISILSKNILPIENKEKISKQEIFEETIMLGLRTKYGLDLKVIKDRFNKDLIKDKNKEINELLDNKLIVIENDYLKATDLGFTVLNKIILDLI